MAGDYVVFITTILAAGIASGTAVLFATNQEEWWIVWEDDRVYG